MSADERAELDLLLSPPGLPHNFAYRDYQLGLHDAITLAEVRRAYVVWHRRAGKDKACFQVMLEMAWYDRVGTYYYIFPTANQGRKALWQNIDNDGRRIFDHIPPALLAKKPNSVEMTIELANGSIVQVVGAKDVDRLVGTNPVGIVFSEWPLHPERNWNLLRPILRLNGGWCIFNGTPRSHNHAFKMWERVSKLDTWYTRLLTWRDTNLLTEADIAEERAEGMPDNLIRQEYECDWNAESEGSWLGEQMRLLREDRAIGTYRFDPAHKVYTFWDLGNRDGTAIWFAQPDRTGQPRVVDFFYVAGITLSSAISQVFTLGKERGYTYGGHWAPHDIKVHDYSAEKSRWQMAQDLGITFGVVPNLPFMDGINALRGFLLLCAFGARCEKGVEHLEQYRKKQNQQTKEFTDIAEHDVHSHAADAARYMAIAWPLIDTGGGREPDREEKAWHDL